MKKIAALGLAAILAFTNASAAKKVLDHTSFDAWKSVRNTAVSNNGEWTVYSVDPQEGDGTLYFRHTRSGKTVTIPRGYQGAFTADGRWGLALVKPEYQKTRKAKIAKKKDLDLPQDSLAVVDLRRMSVQKFPNVAGYSIGRKGGDWVGYTSLDTAYTKAKVLRDKDVARPVVLRHLPTGVTKVCRYVDSFRFSDNGARVALKFKKNRKDTLSLDGVGVVSLPDTSLTLIDREKKFYGNLAFDRAGRQLAYVASNDTAKTGTRRTSVFWSRLDDALTAPREIRSLFLNAKGDTLVPNQYTQPRFSEDGRRLISGVAPIVPADNPAIVDFENPVLDIWRWDAPSTPPQELHNVKKDRENTYPVVVNLDDMHQQLTTSTPLASVAGGDRWNADWCLVKDPTEDAVERQWNYSAPVAVSLVNVNTGEVRKLGKIAGGEAELSAGGRYVIWWEGKNFFTYNIATGKRVNVTERVPEMVWDSENDRPMAPQPFGSPVWSKGDRRVLVYDKYDVWTLDPDGNAAPECLTKGEGRKRNMSFRIHNTDSDKRFVSEGDELLLDIFSFSDKYNGLAAIKYGKPAAPAVRVLSGHTYSQVRKALDKDVYSWERGNFSEIPEIWVADGTNFMKAVRVTDSNPEMKEYSWGTAQLVKWRAYDGKESEGVLYVPEDFDPSKKYPMLCVFYETGSEKLYKHFTMEPSWSWVNYPFYVSRGYVIFVPDIHYTAGVPGESCYNYVCSGAEEMCRRYPWIDKERIGIDGQSWGGYQTAYLVTRTNMFACAGSGAPVANMTSAFGGIRWESGDSRQGQYEQGQSRIGRNLWEAPELYIQNSPVFHANRVQTPLLIMHNDQDGAVPWYQGIEMFMALRRLQKPVWMLQYNGEAHNIRARKNRKDITVRLQQFFDHYLKGAPMPKWMKEGVPATRKGQELGY